MKMVNDYKFLPYLGRFVLIYLATVTVAAVIFIFVQGLLPVAQRVALDFFAPYDLGWGELVVQALRGMVIALVLWPFYPLIVRGKNGLLLLFAAIWGLVLFASMEPKPGSIEGMIYTHTTVLEHFLVMIFGALQTSVFAWLFLKWERQSLAAVNQDQPEMLILDSEKSGFVKEKGYYIRFTLLHIVVYMLVGSLFYQIAGYEEALATMDEFTLWRDLESIGMVAAVFLGQIARGAVIALLVGPFYSTYLNRRHGWLLLFSLLFGLKVLVVLIAIPEVPLDWAELAIGIPEITVQTFVFSLLFYSWEKRRAKKISKQAA